MPIQAIRLDTLNAPALEVLGQALFRDVKITGQADLTNAHFRDLTFAEDTTWPNQESLLRLEGITFSHISPGSGWEGVSRNEQGNNAEQARWESLLYDWVDRSAYSPQVHQQLENAFQSAMIDSEILGTAPFNS